MEITTTEEPLYTTASSKAGAESPTAVGAASPAFRSPPDVDASRELRDSSRLVVWLVREVSER